MTREAIVKKVADKKVSKPVSVPVPRESRSRSPVKVATEPKVDVKKAPTSAAAKKVEAPKIKPAPVEARSAKTSRVAPAAQPTKKADTKGESTPDLTIVGTAVAKPKNPVKPVAVAKAPIKKREAKAAEK